MHRTERGAARCMHKSYCAPRMVIHLPTAHSPPSPTCRYGQQVVGATVRRGSLLVALDIMDRDGATTEQQALVDAPPGQWLEWLQLARPEDGQSAIVQVSGSCWVALAGTWMA